MASASQCLLKPLSTAAVKCCLTSLPTPFTVKSSVPFPHVSLRPVKLSDRSCASLVSWVSLKKQNLASNLITHVAQTSDWARQDEEKEEGVEGSTWENEQVVDGFESSSEGGLSEGDGGEAFPEPPEEAKLFVGNLPFDIDSDKLAAIFEPAGFVEIAEVIYNRGTGQSRGFGFVSMRSVEEAEKAVEMFNQYEINGRPLTVNKAAPRGSQPERSSPRSYGPTFRLYVGNLPWDADNARLEQVFSEHGKVVNARVVYDRETERSRGFGFVTMSSEREMNDAIAALDGQSMGGRPIRVNVAQERQSRF